MSDNQEKLCELDKLLVLALDGAISNEQFEKLDKLIVNDPEIRRYYFEFMAVGIGLRRHVGISSGIVEELTRADVDARFWEELAEYEKDAAAIEVERVEAKVEPVLTEAQRQAKIRAFLKEERAMEEQERLLAELERRRIRERELRRRRRIEMARTVSAKVEKYIRNIAIAAVLMVIGYLVYVIMQPIPASPVATLTDGVNIKWADPQLPMELDSPLRPGPMKLVAGIAQITFDYGAQIVIKAPVEINLESDNRAYLQSGNLSANVPAGTRGFTVNTPNASIVDLGTEFSVYVKEDGSSDVHVYKGKVSLLAGKLGEMVDNLSKKVAQIVEAGQAKRVVKGGEKIEDIVLNRKTFVSKVAKGVEAIPFAYDSSAGLSGRIVYFPFDAADNKRVVNHVNNQPTGQLVGRASAAKTNTVDGSLENEVLKLNGGCVHIDFLKDRGSPDGYTFVMWIRTDITEWQNVFFAKKGRRVNYSKGSLELELFIQEDGVLTLIADSAVLMNLRMDLDDVGNIALRPGSWYHVAAVVSQAFARLYVNGTPQEVQWNMPPQMADEMLSAGDWEILIGASNLQWNGNAPLVEEGFSGFIDEFAVYERILSEAEIAELCRNE